MGIIPIDWKESGHYRIRRMSDHGYPTVVIMGAGINLQLVKHENAPKVLKPKYFHEDYIIKGRQNAIESARSIAQQWKKDEPTPTIQIREIDSSIPQLWVLTNKGFEEPHKFQEGT
jgi:hypothetical protein